uniref:Putative secreted protein n=1 Tax=Ixodes ricinus TaxID=34613 RepID=A0A6B0UVQ6_IXORI
MSSSLAMWCILRWRALSRPLFSRCLAAMHRMWSSNKNRAASSGTPRPAAPLAAEPPVAPRPCTVMCRHRLSSLSPVTSMSCKNPTNLATPQPSRLESGSTRTSCATSITMKRRIFWDSLLTTTVQAIRSLLFRSRTSSTLTQLARLVRGS